MYKFEIFKRTDFSFQDYGFFSKDVKIVYDYLSPQSFTVKVNKIVNCELLDLIRIGDDQKRNIYSGYISNIEILNNKTTLTISPIVNLLDCESIQSTEKEWGKAIFYQIFHDYTRTSPTLYRLPIKFNSARPYTNWGNVENPYPDQLKSTKAVIIDRAKQNNLFLYFFINARASSVYVNFLKPLTDVKTIEADLDNIINKKITANSNIGPNIAIVWQPKEDANGGYLAWIMVKTDRGEFTTDAAARFNVAVPRVVSEVMQSKNEYTYDEIYKKRREMLGAANDSNNNNIKLTILIDDKIIDPLNMQIGQSVKIVSEGKTYNTTYTGYSRGRSTIELTFGAVRTELTKILKRGT